MNLKDGSGRFSGEGISCIMLTWSFYFLVGIFSILKIMLILSKNPSPETTAPSRALPVQSKAQVAIQ
jgi:hypothetical protein